MAIFKCKMCGGTLEVQNNETVAECEYCGAQQTIPKLNDEKSAQMYDRANHFRRNHEFDKAMAIYEQILDEDSSDAEAYWSLVLCRYGIEYVEDPKTRKRVPTVNRAQFTSIFDDDNYKSALQNADLYQKAIYEKEAKAINEIQKGILAISQREEPFDVFICYKETDDNGRRTPDSVLATELYHELTRDGFKVFFARITLEDKLGAAYEPYIFAALNSSKVMVVLGTKPEHFNAVWVKNEWSRYLSLIKNGEKKMLIPAYKEMNPYDLPEEFSHLQAQDMSKLGFMSDLVYGIEKFLAKNKSKKQKSGPDENILPLIKRAYLFLEDGEFDTANTYCEKILDLDPECAEAYLLKLMSSLRVRRKEDLEKLSKSFEENSNYQKAVRFGDEALVSFLTGCIQKIAAANGKKIAPPVPQKPESTDKGFKRVAVILAIVILLGAVSTFAFSQISKKTAKNDTSSEITSLESDAADSSSKETSSKKTSSKPVITVKPSSSKPSHVHSFAAATCTQPQKCSCGATQGKALGHKWVAATCKAPKYCSVCRVEEGGTGNHSLGANGICTVCSYVDQSVWVSLQNGVWEYEHTSSDGFLMVSIFDFRNPGYSYVGMTDADNPEFPYNCTYKNKVYSLTFSSGEYIVYSENKDIISATYDIGESYDIVLKRIDNDTMVVQSVDPEFPGEVTVGAKFKRYLKENCIVE